MQRTLLNMRRVGALAATALLVTALAAACAQPQQPAPEPRPAATGTGMVDIPAGATGSQIAKLLDAAGVTAASEFTRLAMTDPRAVQIQPGRYQLPVNVPAAAALDALLSGTANADTPVVVRPGDRLTDIVAAVAAATGEDRRVVDEQVNALAARDGASLEGRLGVATYRVAAGDTAVDVFNRMLDAGRDVTDTAERLAPTAGRTPQELVTIASLLIAETHPAEWTKAARVIENRLAQGMRLQLDSTAAYASGVRRLELTADQMRNPSPFNTYTHDGLPPSPIGQVTPDAVAAAANPADGTWLYWVTVNTDTGETRFSSSYDDFLKDKAVFREWLQTRS